MEDTSDLVIVPLIRYGLEVRIMAMAMLRKLAAKSFIDARDAQKPYGALGQRLI